jgi:hypothetical protein
MKLKSEALDDNGSGEAANKTSAWPVRMKGAVAIAGFIYL